MRICRPFALLAQLVEHFHGKRYSSHEALPVGTLFGLTSRRSDKQCRSSWFDFLGYTFRPRLARSGAGEKFVSFLPAVSDDAAKAIRHRIKRWRLHLWSDQDLADLAGEINPTVRGWINYYGRFYRTELTPILQHIDVYLVRWAMRKYKRLRARPARANRFLADIAKREPGLFAHWQWGAQPTAG
jgi:RNA-directed DNA polymerase